MYNINKSIKKFKRWISYNPPGALTSKGWRLFRQEFKQKAPVRYWIKHDLPELYRPIRWKFRKINEWIRYRTYDRYHVVGTGLEPGYYGVDQRLLHSSFTLLKDFVEVELAWHSYVWSEVFQLTPRWRQRLYYTFVPFRSKEWAMRHLDWAATLDDPSLPPADRSEQQARDAREIRELYLWWTEVRPARKEIEARGYSDQGLDILAPLDDDFDHNAPDYQDYQRIYELNQKLEEQWEAEDTEMLTRLIKVRRALWT